MNQQVLCRVRSPLFSPLVTTLTKQWANEQEIQIHCRSNGSRSFFPPLHVFDSGGRCHFFNEVKKLQRLFGSGFNYLVFDLSKLWYPSVLKCWNIFSLILLYYIQYWALNASANEPVDHPYFWTIWATLYKSGTSAHVRRNNNTHTRRYTVLFGLPLHAHMLYRIHMYNAI